MRHALELKPDHLRWRCPNVLRAGTFEDLKPAEGTVGQDRAIKALRLGLELRSPGYNVFVSGFPGTGRSTSVKQLLAAVAPCQCPAIKDRAYVFNFRDPNKPKLLQFAVGQAAKFAHEIDRFINVLKRDVPRLLEDESIKRERALAEQWHRDAVGKIISAFETKLKKQGFVLTKVHAGGVTVPEIVPLIEGQGVPIYKIAELEKEGKLRKHDLDEIVRRHDALREEFESVLKQIGTLTKELADRIGEIERRAVSNLVRLLLSDLKSRFPTVTDHLDALGESVVRDLELFKHAGHEPPQMKSEMGELFLQVSQAAQDESFLKYQVNVIQDNSTREGCPIEFEDVPTLANLVGTIEVQFLKGGAVRTSFMNIKGGALLRADGGFLVMNALDLLLAPGAWPALKRVLKTGRLEISIPESPLLPGLPSMKPEPIEIDVKVVLIGEDEIYDLLWQLEDDFKKIFKVKAEFDSEMTLTTETVTHYASVLSKICQGEKLLPFDGDGLCAIVEEGVRRASRQGRITTKFSQVADIAREATYWARRDGAARITAAHIRKAIAEQEARHQLVEEKLQDLIDDDILRIQVSGESAGQVNGLSIYDLGMYAFGRPSRITASVSLGKAGIINIEREAGLSGRLHDKGVLILAGLLRERYAQDFPLSLSASLAFEQSYGGVEGDSASSAEAYALLSALSDARVRQAIAVTGSVDQKGNVQAIGGVNQKIEGFFKVCTSKGLTGSQGVIIPRANVNDLMLREEVIAAVTEGRFHVWAVETIDQGIELLTGIPAGAREKDGRYPEDSINGRVEKRLRGFAETLARFEGGR